MGLAVQDQRVDGAADVIGRAIAHDLDGAGLGIDLDLTDRTAVGIAAGGERHVALGCKRAAQGVVEIVELLRGARHLEDADRTARSARLERAR